MGTGHSDKKNIWRHRKYPNSKLWKLKQCKMLSGSLSSLWYTFYRTTLGRFGGGASEDIPAAWPDKIAGGYITGTFDFRVTGLKMPDSASVHIRSNHCCWQIQSFGHCYFSSPFSDLCSIVRWEPRPDWPVRSALMEAMQCSAVFGCNKSMIIGLS